MSSIQTILSILIVFPVIVFVGAWFIGRLLRIRKRKRLGIAADVTTVVLYFAVAAVYDWLSVPNAWTNLLLLLLFIAILVVAILWKNKSDVGPQVIMRLLWRIYFLVLSTLYFLGWVIGLVRSISQYVSG
ncbi:DUF3397 family protein [Chryseomicrobium aureum]|uniref:DUF3397 family protein n=1 Tax=Chryseomicrobium aureum TaxID=1441723 RepID=UPI00195C23D5|nr:uncharacterized membrane protein YoaK (UPF0700 family) [Chryseomicrobium aureum]